MTQDPNDVGSTIGAALAGCLVSVGLSAVVGFQTFLYFRIYPMDSLKHKIMVLWLWVLDAAHTILLCAAIWQNVVSNFGNPDFIFETRLTLIAASLIVTVVTSTTVNGFYGWRIHRMSKGNWMLTSLISVLLLARGGLALISALDLVLAKTLPNFMVKFNRLYTATMTVPLLTDIVISLARYHYLRNLRQGYPSTQEMVDVVVVFTINDGCLTCAALIATLTCMLRMPTSLVWFGIFCTIPKLYSNSVLATLNLRNWYRHRQRPMGISLTYQRPQTLRDAVTIATGCTPIDNSLQSSKEVEDMPPTMEVFVDNQIEYSVAVTPGLGDSGAATLSVVTKC